MLCSCRIIEEVVNLIVTKGVGMIIPKEFSPSNFVGLEWNLSNFRKINESITPEDSLVYHNSVEETIIRLIGYDKKISRK